MTFIQEIEQNYGKSFKYFSIFYSENYASKLAFDKFLDLDFGFQLGIFVAFFNSVSTDVDIYSNEDKALKSTILDSFSQYEEYLFLDS
jgi:hypothetical protein